MQTPESKYNNMCEWMSGRCYKFRIKFTASSAMTLSAYLVQKCPSSQYGTLVLLQGGITPSN